MKYPLLLFPAGKDYLWGGEKLKTEYGKTINMTPLAETWECSIHPDGSSIVINGEYEGAKLSEVLKENPQWLGSKNKELPVLVKFIDAKQDLSVQVHPDDMYAKQYGDNGKTECWYVLQADKDAELVYGFEHSVTKGLLRNHIKNGTLHSDLHYVPVQKGNLFYIPAGTVHAINHGIVLAEIQESSNFNLSAL